MKLPSHSPRLMMLEFLAQYDRLNERSMFFPFWMGLARSRGIEARWLFADTRMRRRRDRTEGRLLYADPPEAQLASLCRHVADFQPTHLAVSEDLSSSAEAALRAAAPPGLRLLTVPEGKEFHFRYEEYRGGPDPILARVAATRFNVRDPWYFARPLWFLAWLGIDDPEAGRQFLLECAVPDYRAVPADDASARAQSSLVLVSGVSCGGKPSVVQNPLFRDVDLRDCRVLTGCSYCGGSPTPPLHSPATDRFALVEAQLRAIRATPHEEAWRIRDAYMVYDYDMLHEIGRFTEMVLRLDLPPSTFYFSPRLDDVLREREAIEAALPALLGAGHVLKTLIMGIETFSKAEMERFNKRITIEHVEGVLALQEQWRVRFPEGFEFFHGDGGRSSWSFIFFTPWTLPEDIRTNLVEGRRLGLDPTGFWMVSTLMLVRTTPITALARAEGGILADEYGDRGILYIPCTLFQDIHGALPWRFRDPRTALFFRLFVRAFAAWNDGIHGWFFDGDADYTWVRQAVEGRRFTPLDLGLALLDGVEAAGPAVDPSTLLAEALDRAEAAYVPPDPAIAPYLGPDGRPRRTREWPKDEDGPGGPPLQAAAGTKAPPTPRARALHDLARVLDRGLLGDLGRLRLVSVHPNVEGPEEAFVVEALLAGRAVTLDLFPDGWEGTPFLASRSFRLCFRGANPVREDADRRALTLLLALLDHRLETLSRAPLGDTLIRTS